MRVLTRKEEREIKRAIKAYESDPHMWDYDVSEVAGWLAIVYEAYQDNVGEVEE